MDRLSYFREIQLFLMMCASGVTAYFGTTATFVYGALIAFIFNILAGFKADDVKFTMWRLLNFKGNKFSDSLKELLLIISITYLLKEIITLMGVLKLVGQSVL